MVEDGDSKNLPFYVSNHCFVILYMFFITYLFWFFHFHLQRAKTPELVPESAEPMRSGVPKSVKATQALLRLWNRIKDYLADPRMGPTLLLGALLSACSVWWTRSRAIQQPVQTTQQSSTNQSDNNVIKWLDLYKCMPRFRHKPNKERLMIVYRRRRRRRRKRERENNEGGMQRVKRLLLRSLITNLKMLSRFYLQVLILTNNIIKP